MFNKCFPEISLDPGHREYPKPRNFPRYFIGHFLRPMESFSTFLSRLQQGGSKCTKGEKPLGRLVPLVFSSKLIKKCIETRKKLMAGGGTRIRHLELHLPYRYRRLTVSSLEILRNRLSINNYAKFSLINGPYEKFSMKRAFSRLTPIIFNLIRGH